MVSAGELSDELRQVARDLPLGLLAGAVALLESAQQRLQMALAGSSQYEAAEILGLLEQAVSAAREVQQLGGSMRATIAALADKVGSGADGGSPPGAVMEPADGGAKTSSSKTATRKPASFGWTDSLDYRKTFFDMEAYSARRARDPTVTNTRPA